MPEPRSERCETCRFWQPDEHPDGFCHRHAPIAAGKTTLRDWKTPLPVGEWPLTKQDDWCGEWKASRDDPLTKAPLLLEDLHLSVRAVNCLLYNDPPIETVKQLISMTSRQLLDVRSLGKFTLCEIGEALRKRGLALADGYPTLA